MNNPNKIIYAFPSDREGAAEKGMTLRDYFAAKAMGGLVSDQGVDRITKGNATEEIESLAFVAYAIADEMLKARK